jgi:hypothetical protein
VLDSVGGGSHLGGAKLTLADASGRVLESGIDLPADKNGSAVLSLDPKARDNIYAQAAGSAQSCRADFDPSREDTVALYCLKRGALTFPAEAPEITDVAFSDQPNGGWESLPPGANALSGPASKMRYVRVTARAGCAITESEWGPDPINIALDSLAWYSNATLGTALETATPAPEGGRMYYRTTHRFSVPLQNNLSEQDHWLDIVAYDIANNRVERRVYLTVTDSFASDPSDPALAAWASPAATIAQAQTYGASSDLSAIDPIDPYGSFYFTYLTFGVNGQTYSRRMTGYWDPYMGVDPLDMIDTSDIVMPGIRGFEVWRSIGDDRNFRKIDTVRYSRLYNGVAPYRLNDEHGDSESVQVDFHNQNPPLVTLRQTFVYRDTSPDVAPDTMHYKFRAFNANPEDGGYAPFTDVIAVRPLPPFTAQLAAPANGSVSGVVWPTYKFRVTNPELLKAGAADELNFTLYIKSLHGTDSINRMRFMADLADRYPDGGPRCYFVFDEGFGTFYTPATSNHQRDGEPYIRVENGDTVAIDSASAGFRGSMLLFAEPLRPGVTYEWSIFGLNAGLPFAAGAATDAAHFKKAYPAPEGRLSNAFSFGSTSLYGLGSPNGFFVLTVDPGAAEN